MTEENPFDAMPLGYLTALLATVVGSNEQQKQAKEFLKKVDPDIWDEA